MARKPARAVILVALGLASLAGAGAIGYAIGNEHAPVETVQTGVAYETPNEGTAVAGGFAYALPVHVSWIDALDTVHDASEHPPCLRFYRATRATFATVKYSIGGGIQGTVVWVRC